MRRKNRELNIFSMSALDLFASSLGAFILITLILMPYYKKQDSSVSETQQCPTAAPPCPVCPTSTPTCPSPPPPQPAVVMDKLLLIQMFWTKKADIDLHVHTPDGHYYYERKEIPNRPGQLTIDNTKGGSAGKLAKELWITFEPTLGNYKICYQYFAGNLPTVQVWGKLQKPSGPVELPRVNLRPGEEKCVSRFVLANDFNVQMQP